MTVTVPLCRRISFDVLVRNSQRAFPSSALPEASKRRHCPMAWLTVSEGSKCKSVDTTCRQRMSSMVSSSDAPPGFCTLSNTTDCFLLARMRLMVSLASAPLHAFFTSRHAGSNVGCVPTVNNARQSVVRFNGPCESRHWSQARVTKSLGRPAAVTCGLPLAEIASRRGESGSWAVSNRSSICHPMVETWAWICVITPSIPGARSPDRALTICQALIRSSKSKPAPLVDRNVAGPPFPLRPADAFESDVLFDRAITFRMLIAVQWWREAGVQGGFSQSV
ncbi:hypothetical protein D3C76_457410 [compost metagenome]